MKLLQLSKIVDYLFFNNLEIPSLKIEHCKLNIEPTIGDVL